MAEQQNQDQDQTQERKENQIESLFERVLFGSRWLLAPIYFGMLFMMGLLLLKFFEEIIRTTPQIFIMKEKDLTIAILSLIDISLIANLIIIVVFNGYESFVSKINTRHIQKMDWMGKVGFSTLKVKLVSSVIAIASVDMLKVFININLYEEHELKWRVIFYGAIVIAGVMLSFMDKLGRVHNK